MVCAERAAVRICDTFFPVGTPCRYCAGRALAGLFSEGLRPRWLLQRGGAILQSRRIVLVRLLGTAVLSSSRGIRQPVARGENPKYRILYLPHACGRSLLCEFCRLFALGRAARRGAREYLFARRTENPDMARFAARDWRAGLAAPDENGDIERINLWYQFLEARVAADMAREADALPPAPPGDIYYPSVGVFLARRGGWYLAAKAGCNADSHNHNDTGSVILYRDGRPFLIDLGVETYTQKTFSPRRYEIWTMQSQWHNLPTFDGVQQQDGMAFRARDVRTAFSTDAAEMSMELSAAWPPEARLGRFTRTARLTKNGFTMCDVCSGEYEMAFLGLMLCEKPQIDGCRVRVGTFGTLFFEGTCGPIETDTLSVTDERLRIAWPAVLYRLRIPFTNTLTVKAE